MPARANSGNFHQRHWFSRATLDRRSASFREFLASEVVGYYEKSVSTFSSIFFQFVDRHAFVVVADVISGGWFWIDIGILVEMVVVTIPDCAAGFWMCVADLSDLARSGLAGALRDARR